MKKPNAISRALCGAMLLSCSSSSDPDPGPDKPATFTVARSEKPRTTPVVSPEDQAALGASHAAFALQLFGKLEKADKNVVFSPASVFTCLTGALAGAQGLTATQMEGALQITLPPARLHPAMNFLDQQLSSRGQDAKGADGGPFSLKITNALWAQQGLVLKPAFLDVQAESYGAGVNTLDFATKPDQSREVINKWVADQTESRIKDLLPPSSISSSTRLVLTNAVYLNAAWKIPFTGTTFDAGFKRLDGSMVTVKTMQGWNAYRSVTTAQYDAVSLPYQDDRLSMLVVAPKEGSYTDMEKSLTPAKLGEISASLRQQDLILTLPRFKFDFAVSLKEALSALGMPLAFSGGADFSGISPTPLSLSAVLHKAFVHVAEKGTEAAAATAVVAGDSSVPVVEYMNINRPFMFFLRDEPTGAIVFVGRVMDPSL